MISIYRLHRWCCVVGVVNTVIMISTYFQLDPITYAIVMNSLGPSTEYHHPSVPTAEKGLDGRMYVYEGEEGYVAYAVVRHKENGNCNPLQIWRLAEAVGGMQHGKRFLIDYGELQFVGANDLQYPRWPPPPKRYYWGHGNDPSYNPRWDGPFKPKWDMSLLPIGADEQELDLFVIARYNCNWLDEITPWLEDHGIGKGRYLQGGNPDETVRTRVVLRRSRSP